MHDGIYVDNDVVLKVCTYRAVPEFISVSTFEAVSPAILTFAKFTLRSRIERSRTIVDKTAVKEALEAALAVARQLEPTPEEIEIAAGLEERAAASGLAFDVGESQLLAMMLKRNARALVTGDKRAIRALAVIKVGGIDRRIACFEQLIVAIVNRFGVACIRPVVCTERPCDKAITASFSCSSPSVSLSEVMIGLRSYISSLRDESEKLLLLSDDLSAIVS